MPDAMTPSARAVLPLTTTCGSTGGVAGILNLILEVLLRPGEAGIDQLLVRCNDEIAFLPENKAHLFVCGIRAEAVDAAKQAKHKHVLAAAGVPDNLQALGLHRYLADLKTLRDQFVENSRVGGCNTGVIAMAPHVLQQDCAARFQLVRTEPAEEHLFVKCDGQVGFVAAIGEAAAGYPDAIAAGALDAARRWLNFRGYDLGRPDTVTKAGGDRAKGLPAFLGPFARVAQDLDDVFVDLNGRLPDWRCGAFLLRLLPLCMSYATRMRTWDLSLGSMPKIVSVRSVGVCVDVVGIANAEVGFHTACSLAPGSHRQDDRCRAGDNVATCVNAGHGGCQSLVSLDIAPFVECNLRGLTDDRVCVRTDGVDDGIHSELVLAAFNGYGPAAPGIIGFAEFHALAAQRPDIAVAVVENFNGRSQPLEPHAFLLGMFDFFHAGWAFLTRAAIEAIDFFRAGSQGDPERIHCGIAGADDSHALAEAEGRVVGREVRRAHQVAARKQLVGGEDTVKRFAVDTHEARVAGTRADKDGVEAEFVEHLLDREQAPNQCIALDLHAQRLEVLKLGIENFVGEAELGDAVPQHATGLVQRLEDRDLASGLGHVRGTGHAGRARADDADVEAVGFDVRYIPPPGLDGLVTDPAFEAADGHRLVFRADGANAFALVFLGAHAPADGREQRRLRENVVGAAIVLVADLLNEAGNVDGNGTRRHAFRFGTHQAPFAFEQRVFQPEAECDFVKIMGAFDRVLDRHLGAVLRNISYRLLSHLHSRLLPVVRSLLLITAKPLQTPHEIVEIDLVRIEFGPVDAGELDVVADSYAAPAAHAGAVDHDRIHADDGLNAERAGRLGAGLHHDGRANRDNPFRVRMLCQGLLETGGHATLHPGRAIVRADNQLIAVFLELVLPEDQVAVAKTDDAHDVGTRFLEGSQLRVDRRDAKAAADADHLAGV